MVRENERLDDFAPLRVSGVGMVVLRRVSRYLKPTTTAVQLFGRFARRNTVDLDDASLKLLADGIPLCPAPAGVSDDGYAILTYRSEPLGCGLAVDNRLLSQLPRWLTGPLTASPGGNPPARR